jgi:hypothetical protein
MLSNCCFIHLIGNGYNTTTCNEVACMFKGCKTAAVAGGAVCSSGMLKKWLGCGTDHPICIGQRTW